MDGRLAEPTFQEAVDSERDEDEIIIGIQCHGCDYQLWTHVRPNVPTEIRCFREICQTSTLVTLNYDKNPSASLWTVGYKRS